MQEPTSKGALTDSAEVSEPAEQAPAHQPGTLTLRNSFGAILSSFLVACFLIVLTDGKLTQSFSASTSNLCMVAALSGFFVGALLLRALNDAINTRTRFFLISCLGALLAPLVALPSILEVPALPFWALSGIGAAWTFSLWLHINATLIQNEVAETTHYASLVICLAALETAVFSTVSQELCAPVFLGIYLATNVFLLVMQKAVVEREEPPAEGSVLSWHIALSESKERFSFLWNSVVAIVFFSLSMGVGISTMRSALSADGIQVLGALCFGAGGLIMLFDDRRTRPFNEQRQFGWFSTIAAAALPLLMFDAKACTLVGDVVLIAYFTTNAVLCLANAIMLVRVFRLSVFHVMTFISCIAAGLACGYAIGCGIVAAGFGSPVSIAIVALTLFAIVFVSSFVLRAHSPQQVIADEIDHEISRQNERNVPGSRHKKILERLCEKYRLTPREREVASLMLHGRSTVNIGEMLNISAHTAKAHVYHIYQKLNVHSRTEFLDFIDSINDELRSEEDARQV